MRLGDPVISGLHLCAVGVLPDSLDNRARTAFHHAVDNAENDHGVELHLCAVEVSLDSLNTRAQAIFLLCQSGRRGEQIKHLFGIWSASRGFPPVLSHLRPRVNIVCRQAFAMADDYTFLEWEALLNAWRPEFRTVRCCARVDGGQEEIHTSD